MTSRRQPREPPQGDPGAGQGVRPRLLRRHRWRQARQGHPGHARDRTSQRTFVALRQSYTQSHARREEWRKRVLDFYGVKADDAMGLSDLVFDVPDDTRLAQLAGMDPESFEQYVTTGRGAELRRSIMEKNLGHLIPAQPSLIKIANGTHKALLRNYADAYRRLPH